MNILICNDDGYQAKGIKLLAKITSEFANVRVVAPEQNKTAASNALTLHRPLRIEEAENGFYYVNGTPTDCIHLALEVLKDFKPDIVFSGVNHGANLGDDTLYSGTVAAATEGYLSGIPSIAFSLNDKTDRYWNTAEKFLWFFVEFVIQKSKLHLSLLNVNIPRVSPEDIQGIKVTKLGRRIHGNSVHHSRDPYGNNIYWIGAGGNCENVESDTDFLAIEEGFISITPLTVDLTAKNEIKTIKNTFQQIIL